MDADVLIVGGGIAGMSAAYFAARAGRAVTLIDDGRHRASDLPIALVNPLRGHDGRLVAEGVAGMQATFALIDALRRDGHVVAAERGLYRPLVGLDGEALTESYWRARLASRLAFDWQPRAPAALGLVTDAPALHLPEAGWVAAPSLLRALRVASDATLVPARVVALTAGGEGAAVMLDDGRRLVARSVLWCGGAWGAAGLDDRSPERFAGDAVMPPAIYKPGSLLWTEASLTTSPLSFGLYAVPFAAPSVAPSVDSAEARTPYGTLLGPTRETSQSTFPEAEPDTPAAAIDHLQDRVARHFGSTIALRALWRGVRLARLSSGASDALRGIPTLTALGSRGFLTAPLLAARWAQSL